MPRCAKRRDDKIKKYFHELTNDEFEALTNSDLTWGEIAEAHSQPSWCNYPNALNGEMGCWSLVFRKAKIEDYCNTCELFKKKEERRE